ncbi:hypothetical protein [Roseateles terrae]|uniref:Uncharacterized protein n=1 Tax=Roseateles terrae TaxID=431060 RepID=A0ABR6GXZ6_9BURK|nr:hypothetical protein [Roseateles terrae]MBB3196980.1 hypothetical protein [Roseateles terrae]OWQ84487.1 hypothetical protein CDN98_18385 [Roseateles terrae]
MTDAVLHRPPRTRLLIGAALALLVQGVWLGMLRLERGAPAAGPRAGVRVRLLPDPTVQPTPPPAARIAPPMPRLSPRPQAPVLPIEDFADSALSPATPSPANSPSVNTPANSAEPRTRLNLALPPRAASSPVESVAEQATRDPRANRERRGVEWAVQDATDSLPVVIQSGTSGSGTTLIRQGSKCIRVTENRVAALNPMEDRLKGAPSLAGSCFNK